MAGAPADDARSPSVSGRGSAGSPFGALEELRDDIAGIANASTDEQARAHLVLALTTIGRWIDRLAPLEELL